MVGMNRHVKVMIDGPQSEVVHDFVVYSMRSALRCRHWRVSSSRQANLSLYNTLRNSVIRLVKWCWTLSTAFKCFNKWGFQTLKAYSRIGQTYIVYARRNKVIFRVEKPLKTEIRAHMGVWVV